MTIDYLHDEDNKSVIGEHKKDEQEDDGDDASTRQTGVKFERGRQTRMGNGRASKKYQIQDNTHTIRFDG